MASLFFNISFSSSTVSKKEVPIIKTIRQKLLIH